jgi:hypothetical protein
MNSWSIAAFGAFGGLLPTIVRLFELLDKPDATRPTLAGYLSIDTLIIVVAYVGSAAVLATIFPYPRKPSPWLATSVGVAMPTLVGGMASAAKYLGPAALTFRGGEDSTHISWQSLLNLLAIF